MAKEKKEPEGPPPPAAWIATFSDLMNLLLCFFVLLFSMSTTDPVKLEDAAASIAAAFSIFDGGASIMGEGTMINNGVSQLNELSDYYSSMGLSAEGEENNTVTAQDQIEAEYESQGLADSENMAGDIEQMLAEQNLTSDVQIDFTSQYVVLTMNGSLLFDSGMADVKPEATAYLDKISTILGQYNGNLVEVIGHTDNVPISGRYADNMELSCFRALAVSRYIESQGGVLPENLQYSGRGEHVPIANNETPEGRALNRRVEIRIHRELNTN